MEELRIRLKGCINTLIEGKELTISENEFIHSVIIMLSKVNLLGRDKSVLHNLNTIKSSFTIKNVIILKELSKIINDENYSGSMHDAFYFDSLLKPRL